jgi:hypothetical protein
MLGGTRLASYLGKGAREGFLKKEKRAERVGAFSN